MGQLVGRPSAAGLAHCHCRYRDRRRLPGARRGMRKRDFLAHTDQLGASTAGIDPAVSMVDATRSRVTSAAIRLGSAEHLSWRDCEFDAVTAFNALQFAVHDLDALFDMVRVSGTQPDSSPSPTGPRTLSTTWPRSKPRWRRPLATKFLQAARCGNQVVWRNYCPAVVSTCIARGLSRIRRQPCLPRLPRSGALRGRRRTGTVSGCRRTARSL